jgi:hypothetical protein
MIADILWYKQVLEWEELVVLEKVDQCQQNNQQWEQDLIQQQS